MQITIWVSFTSDAIYETSSNTASTKQHYVSGTVFPKSAAHCHFERSEKSREDQGEISRRKKRGSK